MTYSIKYFWIQICCKFLSSSCYKVSTTKPLLEQIHAMIWRLSLPSFRSCMCSCPRQRRVRRSRSLSVWQTLPRLCQICLQSSKKSLSPLRALSSLSSQSCMIYMQRQWRSGHQHIMREHWREQTQWVQRWSQCQKSIWVPSQNSSSLQSLSNNSSCLDVTRVPRSKHQLRLIVLHLVAKMWTFANHFQTLGMGNDQKLIYLLTTTFQEHSLWCDSRCTML